MYVQNTFARAHTRHTHTLKCNGLRLMCARSRAYGAVACLRECIYLIFMCVVPLYTYNLTTFVVYFTALSLQRTAYKAYACVLNVSHLFSSLFLFFFFSKTKKKVCCMWACVSVCAVRATMIMCIRNCDDYYWI